MNPFEPFADMVSIMHRFAYFAYIHCNPSMFTIFIPHFCPPSIITLTMLPQFFTHFFCDQNHSVKFSIEEFYSQFTHHKRSGYDFLTFCLTDLRSHMTLEFCSSCKSFLGFELDPSPRYLDTWQPYYPHELKRKINYGSFVSFKLHDFRRLVVIFNDTRIYVPFRVTNSKIKFILPDREIVFTTEILTILISFHIWYTN
uniref:Uncharacterized protein n=1 Tax=Cucumis melo TaxID=3656 RepID=A0A9I9EKI9_CUCME